ncbi:MAG TPA: hypothetical protein VHX66_11900 [Solirubrobacteraceae bacterium]|nr:hypothetical protein [Solirubrobacteraceae bacterium]
MVLIVAIAAAIPALASGHSTPSTARHAIFCPLSAGRGGLVVRHLKTVKRHRRHPSRHHKPAPTAPTGTTGCYPIPCPTPYAVGSSGRTGATGDYIACRPLPCFFGATGTTGATGMPHPIPFCRPVRCVYVAPVHGRKAKGRVELILPCEPIPVPPCEGPTGVSCPPSPCLPPVVGTTDPGSSKPDIVCRPIVCPQRATAIPANGAHAVIAICPTCPPPVSSGTTTALHACPIAAAQRPPAASSATASAGALKTSRAA